MRNIIFATSSFPYEGGEQFIENEIKFWKNAKFENVYILPAKRKGNKRSVPEDIIVLKHDANKSKAKFIALALKEMFFYREVLYVLRNKSFKLWMICVLNALKQSALVVRERERIKSIVVSNNIQNVLFYSYWNTAASYASVILKKEGLISICVSRAHRGDLYEEESNYNYMPLKRQFANGFDKVYTLAVGAKKYYQHRYTASSSIVEVSALGVDVTDIDFADIHGNRSSDKVLILSVSYCSPVKQIDKIIEAVAVFAKKNQKIDVEYVHIGSGELYDRLAGLAKQKVKETNNLNISFVGQRTNKDVLRYMSENKVDVFVNASLSEGIPVSIMEAMSVGIPAIAPDVGEIAELVNHTNGYLMPELCSVSDVVKGLEILFFNKEPLSYRENAYNLVAKRYNAEINFPDFISRLEKL